MKKAIVILAIALAGAIAFGSTNVRANSGKKTSTARAKAVMTVHQNFPHAQNIVWSIEGKDQIALFKEEGRDIKCLFNINGHLKSTFITTCDAKYLPLELQTLLNKKFPGYVPQTTTEYITLHRHAYYILLKSRQEKVVKWMRIKADEDGNTVRIIQRLQQNI